MAPRSDKSPGKPPDKPPSETPGRPPNETPDELPDRAEIVEKADEYLHDTSLSLEEYESLSRSISELTPIIRTDSSYFVLGSYGREEIRRLQLVKDRLNRRPNSYAFLMVDVRGEWQNGVLKFRVLADFTDHIVGVVEHDRSGFLVEQGLFVAEESYFEKTHVLKREYEDESPYSWMQESVFSLLDRENRLYAWNGEDALAQETENIP
ncbi:hypothetical protein SAMN05421858_2525 [Haladaptatus litoreus]|uniref:Uncharacterized protein n=1 Tax=Haladaptatus litoreus TaxID=553468 RepID=A0A1N7BFC5_9EURY|nr:hypothetical protein [Haladaptatus litoreus]SIR50057.1 hypothetical protein SAMN05421858_2525 [Haladaptatus litoreus]